MAEEKDRAISERAATAREQVAERTRKKEQFERLHTSFLALFGERNPQRRGRALEPVLNSIFEHFEISVRKSFARVEEPSGRVVEQIDGVIELDGHVYLTEMKWLADAVSVDDVSRHLVRVYHRPAATRALFIADTQFSPGALEICREALQNNVVLLVSLEELVRLFDSRRDLKTFLRKKVDHAILDKQPWHPLLTYLDS